MLDNKSSPTAPTIFYRRDYTPPDWLVPEVHFDFRLAAELSIVRTTLHVARNGDHNRPLRLNGDGPRLVSLRVDGKTVDAQMDGGDLIVALPDSGHLVETEVEIAPIANTKLMGLYASSGMLCTQCEAEGFRRITYFPDRPDVLSRYYVKMTAEKAAYPVLLSNGNLVGSGDLPEGLHWVEWHDPFPKPSYLFALVAGDLKARRDNFTTMSGRKIDLAIWVRIEDLPKTAHALNSLIACMKWDEETYGREYDLSIFNIIAVSDFNFGAMENKGLNIFNASYVLADPDTATDIDYDNILRVVGHEYFHNWSGNRVTCRDWFQLCLKEGFTVFREQCFSAVHGSIAVNRIQDVRALRTRQFQEDSGPLAHPVQPESFVEISNFYTATVYSKGAEVTRMLHTLLGSTKFREGSDLYFRRHDGQAVTCEDFVRAMEDASGANLAQFRLWYSQAGTPKLTVEQSFDAALGKATLTVTQSIPDTPGQSKKKPMSIPLKYALFNRDGTNYLGEQLKLLTEPVTIIEVDGLDKEPIFSLNRNFSAPVVLVSNRTLEDLAFLSSRDDDPFGRYEAMQQLMIDTLVAKVARGTADYGPVIEAVRDMLTNNVSDPAFVGETVLLPSEAFIGDQLPVIDPDAIKKARQDLWAELGWQLESHWRAIYAAQEQSKFIYSPEAKGARRLRNIALNYIMGSGAPDAGSIAFSQFKQADNMTDLQAALSALVSSDAEERTEALETFYSRYHTNSLVIDKWFTTQALSTRSDTVETVSELAGHPVFTLHNPNRVRSLVGAFTANQQQFHRASGDGYRFLANIIIELDPINPQVAARQVASLGRWRRFDVVRQSLMRTELERILLSPCLSKDVFEQASKCLA